MPRGKRQPAVYLSHLEAERAAWEEERQRLTARIAELEAERNTLVEWYSRTRECHDGWTFQDEWYATIKECQTAIRKTLESPEPLA
jgi:RNase adaptor protein for sRNA GlmZ degradation